MCFPAVFVKRLSSLIALQAKEHGPKDYTYAETTPSRISAWGEKVSSAGEYHAQII